MNAETEEWRSLPLGRYEVSSLGRVRNVWGRRAGLVLKARVNDAGYWRITLYNGQGYDTFALHRLVALAFHGPCPEGREVNHKDGDKSNNRADNLEYVTPLENHQHAAAMGLKASGDRHAWRLHPELTPRGERAGMARLTEDSVRNIRMSHRAGQTIAALARAHMVSESAVRFIVQRKTWRHVA